MLAQIEIQNNDQFISKRAYNQKITKDLNYLILGENSPQQGISVTVNEKKSNLKINGLLYTGKYGIMTMEADLAASNGFYFFDQGNGSEQGKITMNLFKPLLIWTEQYPLKGYSKANIKLKTLEVIRQAKVEYHGLRELAMEALPQDLFETEEDDEAIKKLKKITEVYINQDDSKGYHKINGVFDESPYKDKEEKKNNSVAITIKKFKKNSDNTFNDLPINKEHEKYIAKILKTYANKRQFILKKLEDSINTLELQSVKSKWASTSMFFFGVSPFYERQSFKLFSYDNTVAFADMFERERGNVYGVNMSLNYNLSKEEGSLNPLKPQNLFLRASVSFSRASNISNFTNSTLDIATPIGNDVSGNPVTFTDTDNAFLGDTTYEYGFGSAFAFDAYYYPFAVPIGFFGIIKYENITFNRTSDIKDKELYPMRLGLLFNLTNKDKKKPLVTIQAFIDRTDLNLKPSGSNGDLRFGIGVGLPINLK